MRLGAYTACLHDAPLPETLRILAGLGLDSAEINSGGFLPAVHLPVEDLRSSETARTEYLALFDEAGVALTALNCNGNPLDPDPEGAKQAQDIYTSIEIAALLGVKRVVTMSGAPGSEPSSTLKVNGTLDDSFTHVGADDPRWLSLGGPHSLSGWPKDSSWDFVAVGRGHDVSWWAGFLDALEAVDPSMAVNIEHEDQELGQMEGLRYAADTLLQAARRKGQVGLKAEVSTPQS